jgi:hypothetical protein
MSDPLANPTTSPKPILGIAQIGIITNCEKLLNEDKDFSKRKHNFRMP